MLRVEFHCHTVFSKDSLLQPQKLLEACRRKGIDRVIITDHNTISGAKAAQGLDPERVIVGEEIMTTEGEILAAFVTEEIPAGLSPEETIRRLRAQKAFISVSHPFDVSRKGSWQEKDLLRILPLVDAIEVYNSRCMLPSYNQYAKEFAKQHSVSGTVGSDAHTAFELGRSVLLLESFDGSDGLRKVLPEAVSLTHWSPPWIHFTSRYATLYKKLFRYRNQKT